MDYKLSDKISEMIDRNPGILLVMSRFGLPLGMGEQTVEEYCLSKGVDADTFISVVNFTVSQDAARRGVTDGSKLKVGPLMDYLRRAHDYFLDFQLPMIRRKLIEAVDCSRDNQVAFMILKFYDEYTMEVRRHMQHENRKIFTYVDSLLEGRRPDGSFEISFYAKSHTGIDRKLQELKNIIVKYYAPRPGEGHDMLNNVLFDIYACQKDLRVHCMVEDMLFVPAVRRLEESVSEARRSEGGDERTDVQTPDSEMLSDREKEVLACAVRGLSNKQISGELYISLNTVLTHRKNISRKLNIHSLSGLTIFAIVNKIVDIEDLKKQ